MRVQRAQTLNLERSGVCVPRVVRSHDLHREGSASAAVARSQHNGRVAQAQRRSSILDDKRAKALARRDKSSPIPAPRDKSLLVFAPSARAQLKPCAPLERCQRRPCNDRLAQRVADAHDRVERCAKGGRRGARQLCARSS
eukprot:Amastigsp_a679078_7.p3 type:complete len:141 gc:universal Amastigsp_a679078_7:404-826(+)